MLVVVLADPINPTRQPSKAVGSQSTSYRGHTRPGVLSDIIAAPPGSGRPWPVHRGTKGRDGAVLPTSVDGPRGATMNVTSTGRRGLLLGDVGRLDPPSAIALLEHVGPDGLPGLFLGPLVG